MGSEDKNSFKQLEKIQEEEYSENLDKVKNSIDGNMNSLSSITNIIDLYFSKVLSYFANMTGGTTSESEDDDL